MDRKEIDAINDIIDKLSNNIDNYYSKDLEGYELNVLGKDISSILYYLSTVRSTTHELFQKKINYYIQQGEGIGKSENKSHIDYPLMYKLRQIMKSGYEVLGMIRTNISYLKSEMNNLHIND